MNRRSQGSGARAVNARRGWTTTGTFRRGQRPVPPLSDGSPDWSRPRMEPDNSLRAMSGRLLLVGSLPMLGSAALYGLLVWQNSAAGIATLMWLNDRLPGGAVVAFLANVLGEVCLAFGLALLVIGAWRGTWRLARRVSVVVTSVRTTVVAAVRAWRAVAARNPPSGSTRVLPGEVLEPRESTIIPGRWRLDATDRGRASGGVRLDLLAVVLGVLSLGGCAVMAAVMAIVASRTTAQLDALRAAIFTAGAVTSWHALRLLRADLARTRECGRTSSDPVRTPACESCGHPGPTQAADFQGGARFTVCSSCAPGPVDPPAGAALRVPTQHKTRSAGGPR